MSAISSRLSGAYMRCHDHVLQHQFTCDVLMHLLHVWMLFVLMRFTCVDA